MDTPLSKAVCRSGKTGADGAVTSTVIDSAVLEEVIFPAESSTVYVIVQDPSARALSDGTVKVSIGGSSFANPETSSVVVKPLKPEIVILSFLYASSPVMRHLGSVV